MAAHITDNCLTLAPLFKLADIRPYLAVAEPIIHVIIELPVITVKAHPRCLVTV